MSRRLQTWLLLSMTAHAVFFALAGSWSRHILVDGGGIRSAENVMMVDWADSPEAAPEQAPVAAPAASPEDSPSIREAETVEAAPPKPGSVAGDPGGNAAPIRLLNMDTARSAWVQKVFVNTLNYRRNAPKGFEKMVRTALASHPPIAGGTAKISFRNDSSGSVGVVVRSDSPELKTALSRVGWETGPLPAMYQIPCSGLDVNITVAGPTLSVGIEIL